MVSSALARDAALLQQEMNDPLNRLLWSVLQTRNKGDGLLVIVGHQVPHEYVITLTDDPSHFLVVPVSANKFEFRMTHD